MTPAKHPKRPGEARTDSKSVPAKSVSQEELERDLARQARDIRVSTKVVQRAVALIDRTPMFALLERELTQKVGRPRTTTWRTFFVLLAIAANYGRGDMLLTHVAMVGYALTPAQRELAGLPAKNVRYWTLQSNLTFLANAFAPRPHPATGEIALVPEMSFSLEDFINGLVRRTLPTPLASSYTTVALDSTDCESWYTIFRSTSSRYPDVDALHLPTEKGAKPTPAFREPPKFGPDGRLIPTLDEDARYGWRSQKQSSTSIFAGYDIHIAVAVPKCGEAAIPAAVQAFSVAPAGSSKTAGGLAAIDRLPQGVTTIINDRGYSYRKDWAPKLNERKLEQVMDLHTNQRGIRPGPLPGTIFIDGGLFVDSVPEELRELPPHTSRDDSADDAALCALYDERARYAFTPMGKPKRDGTWRFRGPAVSQRVRCPNNAASMRSRRTGKHPTTNCQRGTTCACGKTIVLKEQDWSWAGQYPLYGTTQWRKSYGRRSAVEGANSELRTQRFRFGRGCIRVLGQARTAILMAFILAALNTVLLADWYGTDWIDLIAVEHMPPKFQRRTTAARAAHRDWPPPTQN